MENIPIFKPILPTYEDLEKYIRRIDLSRHYTNFGSLENEVRSRLGEYLGLPVDQIVTCSNATVGIQGAIETSGAQGLWEMPAWTFTATPAALSMSRQEGRFIDVGADWRTLPSKKKSNLIDVLPFGQGIGDTEKYELAEVNCLIIDAAASFDSLRPVNLPKDIPTAGILSFHATKVMPAGEGGLFFTNSSEWAKRFRSWTTFGMRDTRSSEFIGTNAKLSEYHSAVLLASLDAWPRDRAKWLMQRQRAVRITEMHGYKFEPINSGNFAAPYWILSHDDEVLIHKLGLHFRNLGIETRNWWGMGSHKMPAYSFITKAELPRTEKFAATSIGLPLWKDMPEETWDKLESAFKSFEK